MKYLEQLQQIDLFRKLEPSEIKSILNCLSVKVNRYKKNDFIFLQGDRIDFVGIVLSGKIQIIREDLEGNVNIVASMGTNDVFAEAISYGNIPESPVSVQASENCEIMLVDCKQIINTCSKSCVFHSKLIENMLYLIARKNIMLNQKIDIITRRTTREKLLAFFNLQIQINHSKKFSIPFNREGLANYLSVDRSSLSRELCSMRDEGLIEFKKNEFQVL